MLALLKNLFVDQPHAGAHAAYIALVERARNPFFYESLGVPDTIDGRFELIVLHLFLLQHRMRAEATPQSEAETFARNVSELFFADMDRSVRELGVADTGVRYRIKAMAKAYHGRLQAYSLTLDDTHQLRSALARNLYGTVSEGSVAQLAAMAAYVQEMRDALASADSAALVEGRYCWPDIATK